MASTSSSTLFCEDLFVYKSVYCRCNMQDTNMSNDITTYRTFNLFDAINIVFQGPTTSGGPGTVFSAGSPIVGNPGPAGGGINVGLAGVYFISATIYFMIPTGINLSRASVGLKFAISSTDGVQGVGTTEEGAMGYIRDSAGHEESSVTLSTIQQLDASDQIQLQFARLARIGTVELIGAKSNLLVHRIAPSS